MSYIVRNNVKYATGGSGGGNLNIVKLTQAEYDALPDSKNSDGILYAIEDGEISSSGGSAKAITISQEDFDKLSEEEKANGIYVIPDGEDLTAKNMFYDDSETSLGNTVQDAIDELSSNLTNKKPATVLSGAVSVEQTTVTHPSSVLVVFDTPFSSAPTITVSSSNSRLVPIARNVTAGSFELYCTTDSSSYQPATVTWSAVLEQDSNLCGNFFEEIRIPSTEINITSNMVLFEKTFERDAIIISNFSATAPNNSYGTFRGELFINDESVCKDYGRCDYTNGLAISSNVSFNGIVKLGDIIKFKIPFMSYDSGTGYYSYSILIHWL